MALNWDYSTLAATYDDRADYEKGLIDEVIDFHGLDEESLILDCGAGTGKLTKELVSRYRNVIASEPNDAMRAKGIDNVKELGCKWVNYPAEKLDIEDNTVSSVWFGSSFNVVDHGRVFVEFDRYTKSNAWLTCLWNHRDLNDPIQKKVEEIFKSKIENYNYGSRRQDPTPILNQSKLFGNISKYEANFTVIMRRDSYVDAWKSHATLKRQCTNQNQFDQIINEISESLGNIDELSVPYTTRLWTCQKRS